MPRRAGLPAEIRAQLTTRAAAGRGLDGEYPTQTAAGTVTPACEMLSAEPTEAMLMFVRKITNYLHDHGAHHVTVTQDRSKDGHIGQLTIQWAGPLPPSQVAEQYAVSRAADGTPRLPAWVNLRADAEFDLRWQPAF